MAKKKQLNIAQNSLLYVTLCICGILAFVALLIYPSQRSLDRLDREIIQHQGQLEKQKILFPVYQELFKQIRLPATKALPFPDETELP